VGFLVKNTVQNVTITQLGAAEIFTFDGSGLASGLYFIRLEGTNTIASQKILLMK
jgi:hypothetical protein